MPPPFMYTAKNGTEIDFYEKLMGDVCVCGGGDFAPPVGSEMAQAEVSPADIASSSKCRSSGDTRTFLGQPRMCQHKS